MVQMADYQTFEKLYYSAHQDSGLATSNIIISSSSPQCYKIYWFITLKDLHVFASDMLNNLFLKNYGNGMSFFGGRGSD